MPYKNDEARREAARVASAKYYAVNKDLVIQRKQEFRRRLAEEVRQIRANTPCTDCKVQYPWYVMEFDHRDGAESVGHRIPNMVQRGSRVQLLAEIAKCDVVCSNCHSIRTHMRRVALAQTEEARG